MTETDKCDLIATRQKLQQKYGQAPTYTQLWIAVANGRIPGRRVGRGWVVLDADLPAVAKHFGLILVPTTVA